MFIIFSISDLQFAEKIDFQNKNNRFPTHLQGKGIKGKFFILAGSIKP